MASNIFEDKKLGIKVKFSEQKHHYCDPYFSIIDGKKQVIGGLGIIKDSLLKQLDIAHKHEVVVFDIDPEIFTNYGSYSTKVEDIVKRRNEKMTKLQTPKTILEKFMML